MKRYFLSLLLFTALAAPAWGATLYVTQAGDGDGTAVGTPDSIADFNAGNGEFADLNGDTVYFMGEFTDGLTVPVSASSEGNRITIRGDYSGNPASWPVAVATPITCTDKDYVTIYGFTINAGASGTAIAVAGGAAPIVDRCILSGNGTSGGGNTDGIFMGNGAAAGIIRNCIVSGQKSDGGSGIDVSGGVGGTDTTVTVHNNKAYDGEGNGFSVSGECGQDDEFTQRNNISYNNYKNFYYYECGTTVVYHNTAGDVAVELGGYSPFHMQGANDSNNVANPSFETESGDDFDDWTETTSGTSTIAATATSQDGDKAVIITRNDDYVSITSAAITVVPEVEYRLSFYTRNGGSTSENTSLQFSIDNLSNGDVLALTDTLLTGGTYQQYTYDFTTPAGCTSIALIFGASSTAGSNPVYIDTVSLIQKRTITLKNNAVSCSTCSQAIRTDTTAVSLTSDYNDFYATTVGKTEAGDGLNLSQWQTATSGDANSINADPLFINATVGDFRLQPGSPAIDNATPLWTFATYPGDYDDNCTAGTNCYVYGTAPDIGAYEYRSKKSMFPVFGFGFNKVVRAATTSAAAYVVAYALLLETGDTVLLETGDKLLLE